MVRSISARKGEFLSSYFNNLNGNFPESGFATRQFNPNLKVQNHCCACQELWKLFDILFISTPVLWYETGLTHSIFQLWLVDTMLYRVMADNG